MEGGSARSGRPTSGATGPNPSLDVDRSMPIGAEPLPGGVSFRVWAPRSRTVHVALERGREKALEAGPDGYFHGVVREAEPGDRYGYRLDGSDLLPDPASRFQPSGPLGLSEVIAPDDFSWSDSGWNGVEPAERALYEMHVGTFTPEGSWSSAALELERLADLGVTLVQIMPVAEFGGEFGWGYDGVLPYAPFHGYGHPDEFRAFVDRAHQLGMGVLLDVVYNHVNPTTERLTRYSDTYFSQESSTPWGPGFDFDGEGREPVREYVIENAIYWIREFHLDGFRLDAADQIGRENSNTVVRALADEARKAAPHRLFIAAESQARDTDLLRAGAGREPAVDALYNEDFHHAVYVALTGRAEAYRSDFRGVAQEMVSLATRGLLYQGQESRWEDDRLGRPTRDLPATAFIHFLQNHDQVANAIHGRRLQVQVGHDLFRAATAYLLLSPGTPMLFQGQEFAASTPFFYFADVRKGDRKTVRRGRADSLAEFPGLATRAARVWMPDPCDRETFERSKLRPEDRRRHPEAVLLQRDLLRIRRRTPALRRADFSTVEGAVLGRGSFLLLFRRPHAEEWRLLMVNLGPDLELSARSEPLLAPASDRVWRRSWHSEEPRYGGEGMARVLSSDGLRVPGHAAVLLRPSRSDGAVDTQPDGEER